MYRRAGNRWIGMSAALSAAVAAAILFATLSAVVFAGQPIPWKTPWAAVNQQLSFKFQYATYPSWLRETTTKALEDLWDASQSNNSRTAQFNWSPTGSGTVIYSSSVYSPCMPSLRHEDWLASSCTAGDLHWRIYIHDFDKAPYLNWTWWDKTQSCPKGKTCFQLRRTLVHEPIHLTGGGSVHSTQTQDVTIFTVGQHSTAYSIGRIYHLLECDEAGAQKAYGLRDMTGPYSTCLPPLATSVGVTGTFGSCQGLPVLVGGRLAVKTSITRLNGNPLAGRTIKLDLDGTLVAQIRVQNTPHGNDWALWLGSPGVGARTYTAHFDGEGPLAASTQTFTVVWVPIAECGTG